MKGESNHKAIEKIADMHQINNISTLKFRKSLLEWYHNNKRILPWRTIADTEENQNKRAYAVWVSEMMLQQTQVSTVIEYFNKWINKWPTVEKLSEATLEEVNAVWAGLGYYSRAKRLHEGAIKITKQLDGEFPITRDSMVSQICGVGKYTGSAVSSIALGACVGVVDGNVARVLSRFSGIGADITSQPVIDHLWKLADHIVDPTTPGDFNQAIMEFGATLCMPKNPQCQSCPLRDMCVAYNRNLTIESQQSIKSHFAGDNNHVESKSIMDIECVPNCKFCLPEDDWDKSLGVMNYPRKGNKTKVRQQTNAVIIFHNKKLDQYFLVQRPKKGLLANLWEFPSIEIINTNDKNPSEKTEDEKINECLLNDYDLKMSFINQKNYISDVHHVFSHIKQTYRIYIVELNGKQDISCPKLYQGSQWMSYEQFMKGAISTAMKKVMKSYLSSKEEIKVTSKRKANAVPDENKKQKTISSFFKSAK